MTDKKPGFFKKLFSSKSRDGDAGGGDDKTSRSPSMSPTTPDAVGGGANSAPAKTKEKRGSSAGQKKTVIPSVKVDPPPDDKKSPTIKTAPSAAAAAAVAKPKKQAPSKSAAQDKARRATIAETGVKQQQQKRLSRKKAKRGGAKGDVAPAAPDQRLEFPTTPEMILAIHKRKPFLDRNEEWLVVELNEYECLVENLDVIKTIATHSKFFEVEPDELWEEFFEYVEEVPSYDEVINYDVWQEFRDEKYPC